MIIFDMQMPNHAVGRYHKIVRWEMTPDSTHTVVNSYATEGMEIISWQDTYTIPLEWKIGSIDDIETILTAPGAPMEGGTIVSDTVETLACAQARKWTEVKIERDKRINGTFETAMGPIQIDPLSLARLDQAKLILTDDETIEWTMTDNTSQPLTGTDIDDILVDVVRFRASTHAASQALRGLIYADDTTMEDVEGIVVAEYPWPLPESPPAPDDGSAFV